MDLVNASIPMPTDVIVVSHTASGDYIRICVISEDSTQEVHFRLKEHSLFKRMKQSYSAKTGIEESKLCFMYKGYEIADMDTPNKLDVKNGDVIDVYQTQIDN